MTITYKKGDLFTMLPTTSTVVIPHVCNNIGGWGSGFVVAVSNQWPKECKFASPEFQYRAWFSQGEWPVKNMATLPYEDPILPASFRLGEVQFAKTGSNNVTVANMIAQNGTVSKQNPKPIKYAALVSCMKKVADHCDGLRQIHAPKFGSALAGGNWEFIEELIDELWCARGLDVTVYEL